MNNIGQFQLRIDNQLAGQYGQLGRENIRLEDPTTGRIARRLAAKEARKAKKIVPCIEQTVAPIAPIDPTLTEV